MKELVSVSLNACTIHHPDGDRRGVLVQVLLCEPGQPPANEHVVLEESALRSYLEQALRELDRIQAIQTPTGSAH